MTPRYGQVKRVEYAFLRKKLVTKAIVYKKKKKRQKQPFQFRRNQTKSYKDLRSIYS